MKNSLPLDFHPLMFCGEARPGLGEDCWCSSFTEDTGLVAVFDGCGGAGARKHAQYADHSEAFMASRLCAGAVYAYLQGENGRNYSVQDLHTCLTETVKANAPEETGGIKIKGMRTLPSTMAAATIRPGTPGCLQVEAIWAGDSRVYVLDASGLSQITVDDSNQPDPMEGLYDDGTLTNLICADREFRLNSRAYALRTPCMVIAATDGCFAYVSTPMEFEGMLLHTLLESANVTQWEENLQKLVASYAGDDHTLCLAAFGFGSFEAMQSLFASRYEYLKKSYLLEVWQTPWENREARRRLWAGYRSNYMKYIEGDGL